MDDDIAYQLINKILGIMDRLDNSFDWCGLDGRVPGTARRLQVEKVCLVLVPA